MSSSVTKTILRQKIPSFGFSGAGFLTCYHFGVIECLAKYGLVLKHDEIPQSKTDDNWPPMLTGVSGGSLAAAAVSMGIRPEIGMEATLAIAERTRTAGGLLDALAPGFSLIDQVEEIFLEVTKDVDEDFVQRRTNNGKLLRIGLTDSKVLPSLLRSNDDAYLYADEFQSIQEIVATCILSSYIPGLTGPLLEQSKAENKAVARSWPIVQGLHDRVGIKTIKGHRMPPIQPDDKVLWDGGIANLLPVVDEDTCIVAPFVGTYSNLSISPPASREDAPRIPVDDKSELHLDIANLRAIRYITFSSTANELESWYQQGYDDALRFLTTGPC